MTDRRRAATNATDAPEVGLSQLQRQLVGFLRQRGNLPDDAPACAWASSALTGNSRLTPVEQLEIYREQFWLRHTSSLVEDFPGLGGILGQHAWERLVEDYLEAHPPEHFSLRDLGARLPAFVAAQQWLERRQLCHDMARLEWAMIECFDAGDAAPLDPEALRAIPGDAWERARLVLHPAIRLLRVEFPVAELRRALRERAEGVGVPYPEAKPENLVIYRRGRDLAHLAIAPEAFTLLEAFHSGASLIEAVERVVSSGHLGERELAPWLTQVLRDWASAGWVVQVTTD